MNKYQKRTLKFLLQTKEEAGDNVTIIEPHIAEYFGLKWPEEARPVLDAVKWLTARNLIKTHKERAFTYDRIDLTEQGVFEAVRLTQPFYKRIPQNPWIVGATFFLLGVLVDKGAIVEWVKSLWK